MRTLRCTNWDCDEPAVNALWCARHTLRDSTNPPHYKAHPSGVECITITEHFGFCLGNVVKYIWRADHADGVADLKKARWYLDREIARRDAKS